jgi:hypothetical protein|tara:strand:- start:167 stop:436 length:270 start_codon:yes stop_codon:yes gene_type:complete
VKTILESENFTMATYRVQRVLVFRADIEAESPEHAAQCFSETEAVQYGSVFYNPENPNSMADGIHYDQGDSIKRVYEDGSLGRNKYRSK